MLIKKLFLSFSVLILFASVISCASETSTEPKEGVINIAIETALGTKVVIERDLQLAVNIKINGEVSEDVEWSSGDENIATVDTNGLVTGVATGTVTITVTSTADNSKTASVSIEVVLPPVGEVWTQVIPSGGHFSGRNAHQAFLGKDGKRLWVIGGYDGSYKNDIWYSDDEGATWNQVMVMGMQFSARDRHQAFLGENGRLWVMGGTGQKDFKDIWYSDNEGVNWNQVTVMSDDFPFLISHQAFLGKDGRLWIIGGGLSFVPTDQILYSDNNGTNWTKVEVSGTHFSAREQHQAFLGEDGRLWVIGGGRLSESISYNDIWYSDDQGVNWTQVTPSSGHFSARIEHQAFLGNNGRLWVMGGKDNSAEKNDIWYSDDQGVNWNQVSVDNTPFSARYRHQAFLGDNGRLWVMGGIDRSMRLNDIWYSD